MWVAENLEDVKSDMSVLHRVDDISALPAASFFPRAERLSAYDGIIRRRALDQQIREDEARSGGRAAPSRGVMGRTEVPADVMLAEHARDGWAERV